MALSAAAITAQAQEKPLTLAHRHDDPAAELLLGRNASLQWAPHFLVALATRPIKSDLTPGLLADVAWTHRIGAVSLLASGGIVASTLSEERAGHLSGALLFELAPLHSLGAETTVSTDLERDQDEPTAEVELERTWSALWRYDLRPFQVALRLGVSALQLREDVEPRWGPQCLLSAGTTL